MSGREIKVRLCDCGSRPRPRSSQCAEDAVEAWIECADCGRSTERFEDAFAPWEQAADAWNRGEAAAAAAQ